VLISSVFSSLRASWRRDVLFLKIVRASAYFGPIIICGRLIGFVACVAYWSRFLGDDEGVGVCGLFGLGL